MAVANVTFFLISPRQKLIDAVSASGSRFKDFALKRRLWEGYQIDAPGRRPQEFEQKVVSAFSYWFEKKAQNEPEFKQVFNGTLKASEFGDWWNIEALHIEQWLTEIEQEMQSKKT